MVLLAGLALLIAFMVVSVGTGAVSLGWQAVLEALAGNGDPVAVGIVRELRLPRVLLAALVGSALSVSGGALQGTLRNPLAEPYLLGVSGGAAVGAVLAVVFGAGHPLAVTAAAFVGAAAASLLVAGLAHFADGQGDVRVLLTAGVVVGAFTNAVILVALADAPPDRVRGALWWMMGSVSDADWGSVGRTALALGLLGGALAWQARALDVIALGSDAAAALGVDVERATRRAYLVASWLAAATVASAGLVGFVGLVVPHLARALGARHHRSLLLVSALYGALLLVGADLAARTVRAPAELPLGAVTAVIGVPFFLLRLRRGVA
jgi:iron complex transport system permease protein